MMAYCIVQLVISEKARHRHPEKLLRLFQLAPVSLRLCLPQFPNYLYSASCGYPTKGVQ